LALSERKLTVFEDMSADSQESFRLGSLPPTSGHVLSLWGITATADSPNASTPGETNGSTISSPRSPDGITDRDEQPTETTAAVDLECRRNRNAYLDSEVQGTEDTSE
jgi:hypothetical protein